MSGSRSIRIGRLAGIPIGVQPMWLLIVALVTALLGSSYYPEQVSGIAPVAAYALGLLSALLLFAGILLHELGHAVVARREGIEIEEIDLWLLGGVARMKGEPNRAPDELRFAAAGPAVTAVIAACFGALALALPASSPAALRTVVDYQVYVNTAILVFNLLPAFPLDGGRVARALIWERTGDLERATRIAAKIGRGFGYGLIGLGLLATVAGAFTGLWFALIGFFVVSAARAEERGTEVRAIFSGQEVGSLMSFPAVTLPASLSVADAVDAFFLGLRLESFPVFEEGQLIGLVDRRAVAAVPDAERTRTTVGQIATYDPTLVVDRHQDIAELLERPAFQRFGRAIVIEPGGKVGIVSITDVETALRAAELRPKPPTSQVHPV